MKCNSCLLSNAQADIQVSCPSLLAKFGQEVPQYLLALGIPAKLFTLTGNSSSVTPLLALTTPVPGISDRMD